MVLPLLIGAAALAAGVADRVAAIVDDQVIALSEVYELGGPFVEQRCATLEEACVRDAELEVLDSLIRRALVRRELKRLQMEVTAADVDEAIDQTVRQYELEDRQALRAEVERAGKRWDQYRDELFEFLRTQRFQGRVLAPRVSVTEDEVRDQYQKAARHEKKLEVTLSSIGVLLPHDGAPEVVAEMSSQAALLAKALDNKELEWEEAVRLYDTANVSAAMTGKSFKRGDLLADVDAMVFEAPIGVVHEPIRIGDVLFIVRVDSRVEGVGDALPFEAVSEELRNQLFMEKIEDADEEWYQRARREVAVDVKDSAADAPVRLLVTPGDPAGIGPEITAKALAASGRRVTVVGDAAALRPWCERYGVVPDVVDPGDDVEPVEIASLRYAVAELLAGRADALVTGPIHKERLARRGFRHAGHTQFLGELCGVERPVMAFVGRVRVALVTVHVPLSRVLRVLTSDLVAHTIRTAHAALRDQLGLPAPRLVVCGPNPHAGDGGVLGVEDADVVAPAVRAARDEGVEVWGPVSVEAAFRSAIRGDADLVVAAYHDQGLGPLKALEYAESSAGAVNWTLGLPILRTSVDHGTADDIAGRGVADERSLVTAMDFAASLARSRSQLRR